MSEIKQGRKRSRLACETCRELKRKCDGQQPCGTCVRFEYDCTFPDEGRGKRRRMMTGSKNASIDRDTTVSTSPLSSVPRTHTSGHDQSQQQSQAQQQQQQSPSSPRTTAMGNVDSPAAGEAVTSSHQRSLEANSGAAFVRRIALRLDPKNAPRMHMFAWNVFLDSRSRSATSTAHTTGAPRSITSLLSADHMRDLTSSFYRIVDPIYGFVDRADVEAYIDTTWSSNSNIEDHKASLQAAVLCGVAALGLTFTQVSSSDLENDLTDTARLILDQSMLDDKCVTAITAWALRVVYLRVAGTPHKTWMASCVLMHMVEAAGLHYPCSPNAECVLHTHSADEGKEVEAQQRKRLLGVAQHLNIWTSFDIGRSYIKLRNAMTAVPAAKPADYTLELIELLPYSALLDPDQTPVASALKDALCAVFAREHTSAPTVLGQVNLALCLYRRLQSLNVCLTGRVLDDMLSLMAQGVRAAQINLDARHPWHHVANVPFQIICVLLSIDAVPVAAQLTDAMQCLSNVAAVYNSEATREAMRTASLLVLLHKRWRERAVSDLGGVLDRFPVTLMEDGSGQGGGSSGDGGGSMPVPGSSIVTQPEGRWLSNLEGTLANMQYFDIDQFFNVGELVEPDGYMFQGF